MTTAEVDCPVCLAYLRPGTRVLFAYSPDQERDDNGRFAGGPGGGSGYAGLASKALDGGFSVTAHGDVPTEGFMVSPYKGAEKAIAVSQFGRRDVYSFARAHADLLAKPDHFIGGWRDGDTIYLDVSVVAQTEEGAREMAVAADQLAIYDIANGVAIDTAKR